MNWDMQRDLGKTYRSVNEAFKDAEYACGITRFEDDLSVAMNWIGRCLTHVIWSAFLGGMAVAVIYWITR